MWDNHGGTGATCGNMTGYADAQGARTACPALDRGLQRLLDDLSDRGMLERTLVVAAGEFGRTPKINKDGGRDHWGACQSAVLAGGGIRGGQVYGSSDKIAAYPKDNPVVARGLSGDDLPRAGPRPRRPRCPTARAGRTGSSRAASRC